VAVFQPRRKLHRWSTDENCMDRAIANPIHFAIPQQIPQFTVPYDLYDSDKVDNYERNNVWERLVRLPFL